MKRPCPLSILALFFMASLFALAPGDAKACAVCACGDPTLTSMGVEQPFAGRSRGAIQMMQRRLISPESGEDVLSLEEWTLNLSYSYAFTDRLQLSATLPLLDRRGVQSNLSQIKSLSLGDGELRARYALLDKRSVHQRHLVSGLLGVKLPTGQLPTYTDGTPLPDEYWGGTGSLDAILGLSYGLFRDPISGWVSLWGERPGPGWDGLQQAPTYLASVALQYQPHHRVSIQGILDARSGGEVSWGGVLEPNTGGEALFGGMRLLVSPGEDVIIQGGISFPLYLSNVGEGPLTSLGVIYDF